MNAAEEVTESLPAGDIDQAAVRAALCAPDQPISIYEVHMPSWMRVPEEDNRSLSFFEIAPKLADHATFMGFTHVQLHAPGYTDPKGLQFLVDYLHQRDLGVILDSDPPANVPPGFADIPADGECHEGHTALFGCDYHWDFEWALEACDYFHLDPIQRKNHQAFFWRRDHYAFNANYILPLADGLVTPPRPSLLATMPGDDWQKFANLRLLFACTYLLPGKKLVFMGDEFGQRNPWRPETSLDWHLLNGPGFHHPLMDWVAFLNRSYRGESALYQTDSSAAGFQWIDNSDAERSVISFLRKSADHDAAILVVLNCTPVPRRNYRVGVPRNGYWKEILNSDALEYGGSGQGNLGGVEAAPFGWNFQSHSLILTLPPLAAIALKAPG